MAARYDFGLNPSLKASVHRIGREQEPMLIVDRLLRFPEQLLDYAATEVSFAPAGHAEGGYPGIRAPAPLNYVEAVVRSLDPAIRETFGLHQVKLARAECNLSIVTTAPEDLMPLQRVPHIDTTDPLQFAFLHFLCDASFGGTAFYRQRRTGLETVDEQRRGTYEQARAAGLAGSATAPDYIRNDTADYEQIHAVEAGFNRLLVYRSRLLHSGLIPADMPRSPDPRRGRLTANIFVAYAPG